MAQIALDAIDREVLIALQGNARLPNNDLAAAGLSPSPCLRRVRRLEKLGAITGLTAFVSVDIERNRKAETDLLRAQIQALPEVVAAHIVIRRSNPA